MLALLGVASIGVLLALILSDRCSPLVGLVVVAAGAGLVGGAGAKTPAFMLEGITGIAPVVAVFVFAIRAPECFVIERELRRRMSIPVFHDDQHGTAVVVAAAVLNGLEVVGKRLDAVKLVVSGAGAAAIACVQLLVDLGLPRSNIWLTDTAGVIYAGRSERMDPMKVCLRKLRGCARSPRRWLARMCSSGCPRQACCSRRCWQVCDARP